MTLAGSACKRSWPKLRGSNGCWKTTAPRGFRWRNCSAARKSNGRTWSPDCPNWQAVAAEVAQQVTYDAKYEGYLARQQIDIDRQQRLAARKIPGSLDFAKVLHLRAEAREKFQRVRPVDLAQAGRISGITPADLAVLDGPSGGRWEIGKVIDRRMRS